MKPAPFDYVRAESVAEITETLRQEGGEARILAGGQSFMAMLNMRLAKPKVLVDIMRVGALDRIEDKGAEIRIGAGVRQAALLGWPELGAKLPLLAQALPWTGHAQTRSRGTICGSIAHADPSAETPLCLVALGGNVHLKGPKRSRSVEASQFFTGMMATAKGDDELIEAVSFPVLADAGVAFGEVARRHGDFAIVGCAVVVTSKTIRLGVGGVADFPAARDWPADLDGDALDDALNGFAWELDARDDVHATARYRRDLVRRLGRKIIEEAKRCHA